VDSTIDSSGPDLVRFQQPQPVAGVRGHEVCGDVHTALSVAQAVLTSRDRRILQLPESQSSETLIRELRAFGVMEAAPQLIAMVALVDAAVERLADAGAVSRLQAWEQLRKDVLRKHCHEPDPA